MLCSAVIRLVDAAIATKFEIGSESGVRLMNSGFWSRMGFVDWVAVTETASSPT